LLEIESRAQRALDALSLKLVNERRFKNGNVLVCYQPVTAR
jgi:hypothetical protein